MITVDINLWRKGRKALRHLLMNLGGRESVPLAIQSVHALKTNAKFKFWNLTNEKTQCNLPTQKDSRQEKASRTQCKSFSVLPVVQEIHLQSLFSAIALLQTTELRICEANISNVRFVAYPVLRKIQKLLNPTKALYKPFNSLVSLALYPSPQIELRQNSLINRVISIINRSVCFFSDSFLVPLESSWYFSGVLALNRMRIKICDRGVGYEK